MIGAITHALTITSFVAVMMLVIEYLNVLSSGSWQGRLARNRWGQYLLAAFLGAVPGCLGAFMVVAMYSHRVLGLGAVVAAMIATSGDESFVMLAMIPDKALLLTGILFVLGIAAGALTDSVLGQRLNSQLPSCDGLDVHEEAACRCFPWGEIRRQWRQCSLKRALLVSGLALFLIAFLTGTIGPATWNFLRFTLLFVFSVAIFIVVTVPDHFLEEHLWRHVAVQHVPRIFLWTLGALVGLYLLQEQLHLDELGRAAKWFTLVMACLVGLIPESGPHLIFVTLYAQGVVPLSILLASSIVQDGHGMLPLLAHSRWSFLLIKAINLLVGLAVGACMALLGY